MFVENKHIDVPESCTVVWKYMDLSKFLDLLLCNKMFMARADKFEDKYEGTFSEPTFEELKRITEHKPGFLDHYKKQRENVVISSWHINEYESYAMWQIFTKNNEGLAIQSTIGRIEEALAPEARYEQHIGEVKYIDYKKEFIPFDNDFFPFLFKRKSFQYEREVRVISDLRKFDLAINDGLKIDTDVNRLIEKIYIHPKSENWYKNLVTQLIEKLGYNFSIEKSDLESDILI